MLLLENQFSNTVNKDVSSVVQENKNILKKNTIKTKEERK